MEALRKNIYLETLGQIKEDQYKTKEMYLYTDFLLGADSNRHGNLIKDLQMNTSWVRKNTKKLKRMPKTCALSGIIMNACRFYKRNDWIGKQLFEVNEKPENLDKPNAQIFRHNMSNIFYAKGKG